ncbi:hypothetical protein SDC9_150690 [bioreactor metagenome]|uniref:Uncharacterized protein n=1 Tax=bioreactor metagenome TaxID=1076179 RepID=A0A645EQ28_9ZZZZ
MHAVLTFSGISKSGSPTLKGTILGLLAVISKNLANPDGGNALINGETTVLKSNVDISIKPTFQKYITLARKNVLHIFAGRKIHMICVKSIILNDY